MSGMIGQERRGATLIVTIDNPAKGNALTLGMLDALEDCAITIERDRSIRAVVITGAGEKAFCTGADINEWSALDAGQFSREWVPKGHRLFDRLARLPVPLIAAVNGMAFGGGLELLATSDLRIAAPHAQFALNAANGEGTAAALDSLSGALIAASSDKAEGVASFKEKRKPNFHD